MNKYIFLMFSVFPIQAWAVGFHCYSMPTIPGYQSFPVQTVEYSSGICMDGRQATDDNASIGQDGERPVMCMVSAGCKVVSDEDGTKPAPALSQAELADQFQKLEIKPSVLICKGTTTYKDGKAVAANCPSIQDCKDDILFHYFPANLGTSYPMPVNVPNPESSKIDKQEGRARR